MNEPPTISTTRFARELGMNPQTVRGMVKRGEISSTRGGKKFFIPVWELEKRKEALNSRGQGVAQ
jgi:Mn-dependent DtxR family transcriptional regulator